MPGKERPQALAADAGYWHDPVGCGAVGAGRPLRLKGSAGTSTGGALRAMDPLTQSNPKAAHDAQGVDRGWAGGIQITKPDVDPMFGQIKSKM